MAVSDSETKLRRLLEKEALVDSRVVDFIINTMQVKSIPDFVHFWKLTEYEDGVSTDIIERIPAFNGLIDGQLSREARLQRGRVRAAWMGAFNAHAQFQLCTFAEVIDNASEAIMSEWFAANRPTEEMFVYALRAAKAGHSQAFDLLMRDFQRHLAHVSGPVLSLLAAGIVEHAKERTMVNWFAKNTNTEEQERCFPAVELLLKSYTLRTYRVPCPCSFSIGRYSLVPDIHEDGRFDLSDVGELSWPMLEGDIPATLDLGAVQSVLRARAVADPSSLSRAIGCGQTDLVYMLLCSGISRHGSIHHESRLASNTEDSPWVSILGLQGARDDNAADDMRDTALKIAQILITFEREVPACIIDRARANGQHCLAQVFEVAPETQSRGLRYALHALKLSGIPEYLRFDIGSFLMKFPEHLRPCVPAPLEEDPATPTMLRTDTSAVSNLLEEMTSAPDPIPSVRALPREVFFLFESCPKSSSADMCQLLQTMKAAVQGLSPKVAREVARELSDAFNHRTPPLEFVCRHVWDDAALLSAVIEFLEFLNAARKRHKSLPSGDSYQ